MGDRDDQKQPNKRKRKRRRKRSRRRRKSGPKPPAIAAPGGTGDDIIEVGRGEFAVVTVPHDDGPTVIHRFETEEEARKQHTRNVEADAPLVDVGDEEN